MAPRKPPHKRKSSGRPLQDTTRRVRASYTLPPQALAWLSERATEYGVSQSVVLERVIAYAQQAPKIPGVRARVPIPRESLHRLCREYGVDTLQLFGSVLRPDFTPTSDIDVLVQFPPSAQPTYFTLVGLTDALTTLFRGRRVDLHTPAELSPYFREQALAEAEVIYAQSDPH